MSHNKPSWLTTFSATLARSLVTAGQLAASPAPTRRSSRVTLSGRWLMSSTSPMTGSKAAPSAPRGLDVLQTTITAQFRNIGLTPAGSQSNYFQYFPIRKAAGSGSDNAFIIGATTFSVGTDWMPFGFSASIGLEGTLIFGGYGLSSPRNPQDEYTRLNISRKVAVLDWGDPDAPQGGEARNALGIPVVIVRGDLANDVRAAARNLRSPRRYLRKWSRQTLMLRSSSAPSRVTARSPSTLGRS